MSVRKKRTKYVTIKMTQQEGYERGLLVCECGWPKNNHYDFGKKECAHNNTCTGYKEVARVGKLIK